MHPSMHQRSPYEVPQRISQRRLDLREGREGPKHDPYSWTEYIVKLNGIVYSLRLGSLGYAKYRKEALDGSPGSEEVTDHTPDGLIAVVAWENAVGMSVSEFRRYYDRLHRDDIEDPMGPVGWYI